MSPINKHEIRGTFKLRITDIIFGNWQLYSIGKLGLGTFRNSYDFTQVVYDVSILVVVSKPKSSLDSTYANQEVSLQ